MLRSSHNCCAIYSPPSLPSPGTLYEKDPSGPFPSVSEIYPVCRSTLNSSPALRKQSFLFKQPVFVPPRPYFLTPTPLSPFFSLLPSPWFALYLRKGLSSADVVIPSPPLSASGRSSCCVQTKMAFGTKLPPVAASLLLSFSFRGHQNQSLPLSALYPDVYSHLFSIGLRRSILCSPLQWVGLDFIRPLGSLTAYPEV